MLPTPVTRRRFLHSAAAIAAAGAGRLCGADAPPVPSVLDVLRDGAADAPLSMRFSGATPDDVRTWQREFGEKLRELLGPHRPPNEWKSVVVGTADQGEFRRDDLVLSADGHPSLPVSLLVPKARNGRKLPGVVALHGHGAHGHHPVAGRDDLPGVAKAIEGSSYDYGRQLARRGYAVAVPCLTPFGDRLGDRARFGQQDPCADTFLRMQVQGKVLVAENLRDCLWAVELLARHEAVDSARLACVGLSYGGRMTTLTAAVEPRIRVAVISGALNVMQERTSRPYSCGAQIIPGLLRYGDIPEIAALIAPRHCLWEAGLRDSLIDPDWANRALDRMRPVWKALGAADRLQVDRFDGGHVWNGKAAFPLLDSQLGADSPR